MIYIYWCFFCWNAHLFWTESRYKLISLFSINCDMCVFFARKLITLGINSNILQPCQSDATEIVVEVLLLL